MKNKKTVLTVVLIALIAVSACAQQGGKSINSAKALKEYIDSQPANTPDKPIKVSMSVNDLMMEEVAEVINSADKYVSFDLSGSAGLTKIGNSAFNGCSSLTSITIPNSVTSIGNYAFSGCDNLTSVTIGNSVTSIGMSAFRNCDSLTSVTIPNSVTSIGGWAFFYCTSLKSVTIGNGVTSIGDWAFRNCDSLASVTMNGVTSIGNLAFDGCTSLKSVTIGNSVTSIDLVTLRTFVDLTAINVAAGNSTYTSENGILYNKDKTTLIRYPEGKTGSSFTIPNSVTSIGNGAFSDCDNLTSITILDSVTSIGNVAFYGCTSLVTINVAAGNSTYTVENGVLYNKGKTILIAYPAGKTNSSFTIPDSVTSIGNAAFSWCSSLTSVTIPSSVTSIGNYAFGFCTSLTSVTFLGTIPSSGFYSGTNFPSFNGDLRDKFFATNKANGTPGTYTRPSGGKTWTRR